MIADKRRHLLASTCVKPPPEPDPVTIINMIPGCTYTALINDRGVVTEVRGPRRNT